MHPSVHPSDHPCIHPSFPPIHPGHPFIYSFTHLHTHEYMHAYIHTYIHHAYMCTYIHHLISPYFTLHYPTLSYIAYIQTDLVYDMPHEIPAPRAINPGCRIMLDSAQVLLWGIVSQIIEVIPIIETLHSTI